MRSFLLILALIGCVPTRASAVTIDEIVALSKSGVSEQVILAVIDRDQTLFTLSPALIMKLQRDGLSDKILLALIKSGHPNAPLASASSPGLPPAAMPPPAAVTVVGHDPEPPNTAAADFTATSPPMAVPAPIFVPVPVLVPVPSPTLREGRRSHQRPERYLEHTANPLLCVERVSTGSSPFAPALTRVTECPAVMQRYRDNR
jgi:hypothetical protein